jgi:DNA invertase Pin-like site-specific DNA recombinase
VKWKKDRIGANDIKELYLKEGMTTAKVAKALGISKSMVIVKLHKPGIRRGDKA